VGDAVGFVAQHHDGAAAGRWQFEEADRLVGEFHADDVAVLALRGEPGERVVHPVHARRRAQRVALGQRLADPRAVRHGQARADRVAVRRSVPRLTPYLGHSGATIR
jgi:hypothetical protein